MARPLAQAALLVDGYNIIGAWSSLQETCNRLGLEAARLELAEALTDYSAFQGFSTQLIFDAQYRNSPGNCEVLSQNLAVYYTEFGQTADTYIEKICALSCQNLRKFQQRMIVATSDRAQQLIVVGYGAEWMSAQKLRFEVESIALRARHHHKPGKQTSSRFLANSLDPKARQRLAELRMELKDL
jgi:predicted RNA-binding protein with PIN domain